MRYKLTLTLIITWTILSSVTTSSAQGIGYRHVHYIPQSETIHNAEIPITPAIEAITVRLKYDLKSELKGLKKRDAEYQTKRQSILRESTIDIVSSLVDVLEVESLRTFDERQALKSVYQFLDCWADKNFKSKKKDFCKGCWDEHIEKERLYQSVVTVEE